MQGAPAALKKAICSAMRSFSAAMSPSSSRPENQPPQTLMPYCARIGLRTAASIGKRRPVSMPVKPASLRLAQAFLQADVVGKLREVVVPPGDRGDAESSPSSSHTPTRCLARIFDLPGAGLAHALALGDLGHAHVPVGVARHPGEGVGVDGDDRGAVGRPAPRPSRPRGRRGSRSGGRARPSTRRAWRSRPRRARPPCSRG